MLFDKETNWQQKLQSDGLILYVIYIYITLKGAKIEKDSCNDSIVSVRGTFWGKK